MASQVKQFVEPTVESSQGKDSNVLILRIVKGLIKNHPPSQRLLNQHGLVKALYTLSI